MASAHCPNNSPNVLAVGLATNRGRPHLVSYRKLTRD